MDFTWFGIELDHYSLNVEESPDSYSESDLEGIVNDLADILDRGYGSVDVETEGDDTVKAS